MKDRPLFSGFFDFLAHRVDPRRNPRVATNAGDWSCQPARDNPRGLHSWERQKPGSGTPAGRWRAMTPWEGTSSSEEHTSELQSLMRISYAVFSLKQKINKTISSH